MNIRTLTGRSPSRYEPMEAIVAVYSDWGIGLGGTQPVVLKADRAHFRELTAGTAVITAANADGKTADCTVTVTGTDEEKVTAVTLNCKTLTLTVGGTATLKATVSPKKLQNTAITWKSNNAAVARVDKNGKVTALKTGTAVVTASAGGVSARCTVTVKKKSTSGGTMPSAKPSTPGSPSPSGSTGTTGVTGVTGGAGILYLPGTLIPADSVRE